MPDEINELDLMTLTDIATLLGVSRTWAHSMSKQEGFPAPVYRTRAISLWRTEAVRTWATKNNHLEVY